MPQRQRVLVTGASGLLGRAVLAAFESAGHDARGTAFSRASGNLIKCNLQDRKALEALLQEMKPHVVVHCAAERRPDVAEKDPEAARSLNVDLPATLSELSKSDSPFHLIYISTDYVFDGQNPPQGGYTSADSVNPTNEYARTKLAGENAVLSNLSDVSRAIVLRVPVLYGEVTENAESAINILVDSTRAASAGKVTKMDNWAQRRPTNVTDVARVLVALADKIASGPVSPILSFSAQPAMTKYDICQLFARLEKLTLDPANLVPANDGPGPRETIRPRDCWMSNAEIEAIGVNASTVDFESWWSDWFKRHGSK